MTKKHVITTESGSEYIVWDRDGKFSLSANNVPNPHSEKLPRDLTWELVDKPDPWPPVKGQPLLVCFMKPPSGADFRLKRTSPVKWFYQVIL